MRLGTDIEAKSLQSLLLAMKLVDWCLALVKLNTLARKRLMEVNTGLP